MMKLTQLLSEVLVKNKKTGNVYNVVKMNPQTQEKPTPKDIKKATTPVVKPTASVVTIPGKDVVNQSNKKNTEDSIIPSDKKFTEAGLKAGYNFNQGDCDLFARAMHRVTGYPIVVIKGWTEEDDWDDDGETELVDEPYHVMVQLPNGKFRDADGEYTLKELKPLLGLSSDNGIKKVTAEPIEDKDVKDVYGSNYKDDEIKKVMDLIIKNKSVTTKSIKENMIKLKDLLSEAYNPAEAFNKKVSKMTDRNEHSEAAVELAIYMDDRDAVSKLNQIKKDHIKNGSITPADQKKRDEMVNKLLKKAKKELSDKDYKLINSSF